MQAQIVINFLEPPYAGLPALIGPEYFHSEEMLEDALKGVTLNDI